MEINETFNRKLFTDHLLITAIIAVVFWGSAVVLGMNGITIKDHPWITILQGLGAFSTTIASYIALKKNGKVTGFKAWIKNVFDFKHNALSYILVIALAFVQALLQCLIGGFELRAPLYMIVLMLPIMFVGGGMEEWGWRYITFPELDKKFGFIIGAFITSIIWAVWHLPLFFIPDVHQYGQSFLGFTINVIGVGFAVAAIRKVTGSIWLCTLFHMIVNAIPESLGYDFYNPISSLITTIIMIAISVMMVFLHKKRVHDAYSKETYCRL